MAQEITPNEFVKLHGPPSDKQIEDIRTGKIPLSYVPLDHPYWKPDHQYWKDKLAKEKEKK